jgi:hypothetical protein
VNERSFCRTGNRMKSREFVASIGEAAPGRPVLELEQRADWIQGLRASRFASDHEQLSE